jgi:ATP synthase, F1 epsilon subunit (delta in mitochondria)
MSDNFKLEIISPEKTIFSGEVANVTLPSYEGNMGILKNHISTITFLRPGIIKVNNGENFKEFFVQDGTVKFFNNILVVLSKTAVDVKSLTRYLLENLSKETKNKLDSKDISDQDRYILHHKLDVIEEITVLNRVN